MFRLFGELSMLCALRNAERCGHWGRIASCGTRGTEPADIAGSKAREHGRHALQWLEAAKFWGVEWDAADEAIRRQVARGEFDACGREVE